MEHMQPYWNWTLKSRIEGLANLLEFLHLNSEAQGMESLFLLDLYCNLLQIHNFYQAEHILLKGNFA